MKTIIVSDLHLTAKFDQKKYICLKKLFESCDKLIINGDFWSCYSSTFEELVNSKWKQLFPIMLGKKAVYIYGNHDRSEFMDQRVNLFSVEQRTSLNYSSGEHKYHIEHGHLFFKHQSISNPKFISLYRKLKIDERIRLPLESLLFKKFDLKTLTKYFSYLNKEIKIKNKQLLQKGIILVVGHTHAPENNKVMKFVNTGFIGHNLGWYLVINIRGYNLVKFTY